jgi:hypothetical protein
VDFRERLRDFCFQHKQRSALYSSAARASSSAPLSPDKAPLARRGSSTERAEGPLGDPAATATPQRLAARRGGAGFQHSQMLRAPAPAALARAASVARVGPALGALPVAARLEGMEAQLAELVQARPPPPPTHTVAPTVHGRGCGLNPPNRALRCSRKALPSCCLLLPACASPTAPSPAPPRRSPRRSLTSLCAQLLRPVHGHLPDAGAGLSPDGSPARGGASATEQDLASPVGQSLVDEARDPRRHRAPADRKLAVRARAPCVLRSERSDDSGAGAQAMAFMRRFERARRPPGQADVLSERSSSGQDTPQPPGSSNPAPLNSGGNLGAGGAAGDAGGLGGELIQITNPYARAPRPEAMSSFAAEAAARSLDFTQRWPGGPRALPTALSPRRVQPRIAHFEARGGNAARACARAEEPKGAVPPLTFGALGASPLEPLEPLEPTAGPAGRGEL